MKVVTFLNVFNY